MDPNEILGVAADAPDEDIRAAYLNKVKEFPPDRAPEEFERIRDAYDAVRDPRKRARALFQKGKAGPGSVALVSLLEGRRTRRAFAGPQPWREVLKSR